jgi:hypothetical protein
MLGDALFDVIPGDELRLARLDQLGPAGGLLTPGFVYRRFIVRIGIEAREEISGEVRPIGGRQLQRLLEQVLGCSRHCGIVPPTLVSGPRHYADDRRVRVTVLSRRLAHIIAYERGRAGRNRPWKCRLTCGNLPLEHTSTYGRRR